MLRFVEADSNQPDLHEFASLNAEFRPKRQATFYCYIKEKASFLPFAICYLLLEFRDL